MGTIFTFLDNLLNVLVQIANKMGFQKNGKIYIVSPHIRDLTSSQ
jgi:hypothetical protein